MAKYKYYCENKYKDPCEYAKAGRTFSEGELPPSMDGGAPRCPGKTESGKDCGEPLVRFQSGGGGLPVSPVTFGIGAGLIALGLVAWFLWPFGGPGLADGMLEVVTDPVFFMRSTTGVAAGELRVRNNGGGALTIERVDVHPAAFSSDAKPVTVASGDVKTLFLRFYGDGDEPVEGTAELHSDATKEPVSVRLIANRSPWWVYEQLERQSRILNPAPQ